MMRQCPICNAIKDETQFSRWRVHKRGPCKQCHNRRKQRYGRSQCRDFTFEVCHPADGSGNFFHVHPGRLEDNADKLHLSFLYAIDIQAPTEQTAKMIGLEYFAQQFINQHHS